MAGVGGEGVNDETPQLSSDTLKGISRQSAQVVGGMDIGQMHRMLVSHKYVYALVR